MIQISQNVSKEQFDRLQAILNGDKDASIQELGGFLVTNWIGAFDGARLVGFVGLAPSGQLDMEMYKLYVDPSYRRQKIAKSLVIETLRLLKEKGYHSLDVEVSESGFPFWSGLDIGYPSIASGNRLSIRLVEPPEKIE